MRVGHLYIIGQPVTVSEPEVNKAVLEVLYNCLILNTDAHLQMEEQIYEPIGSPVDVGLMKMLVEHNVDVQDRLVQRERQYEMVTQIPFSSSRKCRTVAYRLEKDSGIVRVVVKGAPEIIIPKCESMLDQNCEATEFHDATDFLVDTVANEIAKTGMKPLSIAYRDFNQEEFEQLKADNGNFESEESRQAIESSLIHVATVGLIDELRQDVDVAC